MADQTAPAVHVDAAEEEDHDLLTFTEVHDRLGTALLEQERRIVELDQAGDTEQAQAARGRLALMLEARERHSRVAITAVNAEQFYGLEPEGERQVLRGI
ncbi:MAG: hypothetical protein JWO60_2937 [Frankiales bacterium]|nr:hypothetical protein [Frankiales bacterium]